MAKKEFIHENIIVLIKKNKPDLLCYLSSLELTIKFLMVHRGMTLKKTIRQSKISTFFMFMMCCIPQAVPYGVLGDLGSLGGVPQSDTPDQEAA